jgi:phosphoglycerate dehydrogenase-like enzyme
MKLFILDQMWSSQVTPELSKKLTDANLEVIVDEKSKSLKDVKGLFDGSEERILAINPDNVDWAVKAEDYKEVPNLKAILLQSTSFSWLESVKDIPVCNIRGFSAHAVAEWNILMAINLARKIPLLIQGSFEYDLNKYQGIELQGKTAGIIGIGQNGTQTAKRCKGLGMNVVYWSHKTRNDEYEYVELTELFKRSDLIIPAMADNKDVQKLITDEMISSMKRSAIFVSTVHRYYNHQLLLDMVKDGRLFGYGFETEGKEKFSDFTGNIWATPPYAWCTDGSMSGAMNLWVNNMVSASKSEFPNRINK